MHKAGKVRILAVADVKRAASLPDVPTFAEIGLQAVTLVRRGRTSGHASRSRQGAERVAVAAIGQPDVRSRFNELGRSPVGSAPDAASRVNGP
ncbi:hypothetical protein EZ313_21395 [Ramlibacter henchirensis]|uniref:Uncharacterized protein n=1 Tax=Ramlibacter henchirensis TaxID=204072 RepID=A0A4Z0BNU4_9BURK|nr:hypothetical protein EZ313_21395 [Ramlibacter henchirensis]